MSRHNCKFFFGPKNSNYLHVKVKVFKRGDNRDFYLVQNFTMGEEDFNPFMRLRNELVIEARTSGRKKKLSPVLVPTMSRDTDEQLKLAHNVVEILDKANGKICVTMLRYIVDKPGSSYVQV